MLVWPYGKTLGRIMHIARDVIRNGGYMVQPIEMTGQIVEDEGMVCGGMMEVVIESCVE